MPRTRFKRGCLTRLRAEGGFGLVELTIALTMLAVGVLGMSGLFITGHYALRRASQADAASVLADQMLERYRAITWDNIALSDTAVSAADSTYVSGPDSPLASTSDDITATATGGASSAAAYCSSSPLPVTCNPSRVIPDSTTGETAPDARSYRIDTYVTWGCPDPSETLGGTTASPVCSDSSGNTVPFAPVKVVTVVIRDASALAGNPVYQTSTSFDRLQGGSMPTVTVTPGTTGTTTTTATTTTATTTTTPSGAPSAPNSVALANGGGTGSIYIDSGNATSLNADVSLPSTSASTDVVHLQISDSDPTHTQTFTQSATQGSGLVHFTNINGQGFNDGTITFTSWVSSSGGQTSSITSATATKDTVAPDAPSSVALQNGQGQSGAYINISTKSSVNVTVGLDANSLSTDTVSVTLSSGSTTSPVTAAASSGAGSVTVSGINASALTDGTVTASATATDAAGNTSTAVTSSFSKDTVAPTLTGVDSSNKSGGTSKKAEQGDTVTLTFSEAILAASVPATSNVTLATSNGSSKPVTLTLTNLAAAGFQVGTSGSSGYLAQNSGGIAFNSSTLSQPAATQVRVTLGTCSTGCSNAQAGGSVNVSLSPYSGLTDLAGNSVASTALSATGKTFF